MIGGWHIPLAAEEDWEPLQRILPLILLLALAAVGAIVRKMKEKYEQQQGRREEEQYEREYRSRGQGPPPRQRQAPGRPQPPPARQQPPTRRPPPAPAERAVSVLRELLTGRREPEPPPVPAARERVARRAAPPRPAPAERREKRLAGGVEHGVERMEHELEAEELQRRQRMGELKTLRPTIGMSSTADRTEDQVQVLVDLGSRREALRAIIYSEILGLPKALRRAPEPWER